MQRQKLCLVKFMKFILLSFNKKIKNMPPFVNKATLQRQQQQQQQPEETTAKTTATVNG